MGHRVTLERMAGEDGEEPLGIDEYMSEGTWISWSLRLRVLENSDVGLMKQAMLVA